jgi:hypothetical protein
MQVEFVQTLEDYVAFNRHHSACQPWWRRHGLWVFGWPLALVVVGMILLIPRPLNDPASSLKQSAWHRAEIFGGAVVIATLTFAFVTWRKPRLVRDQLEQLTSDPRNRKRMLGWRRCIIDPEGMTLSEAEGSNRVAWTAVLRIASAEQHAFLYTTTNSAIIVPRRTFSSDEEFHKFVAMAREYRDAAVQNEPQPGQPIRRQPEEGETGIKRDDRDSH